MPFSVYCCAHCLEQLGLERGQDAASLVQKQRAAVGHFKESPARALGIDESAFSVAEDAALRMNASIRKALAGRTMDTLA